MNQRFFGRKSEASVSEVDGQLSLFDSFNEAEYLKQDSLKEPEIPQHMDDKVLRFLDDLLPWSPRVQKECPSKYIKS